MTDVTTSAAEARVRAAAARVEAISLDQPDRNEREGSQITLMREFLRRAALWAHALDREDEWPFFSVAERVAERSDAARARLEAAAPAVRGAALKPLPYYPQHICMWYVQWCAIEDLDEVRAFGLPDPYEPAIRAFERGGVFYVEQRMFQFGVASVPLGSVETNLERPPFTALDEESLARRDAAWKAEVAQIRRGG